MTLTILLLRGINLGGRNRLAMADLKTLAERVHVTPTQVWLHTPEYLSGSLNGERMDRLMGVPATARNWHSVSGIHALAEKLAG